MIHQMSGVVHMESKRIRKREMLGLLAVMAVLSGVTFYALFKAHSVQEISAAFQGADGRFVLAAVLCMVVYMLCETESIRTLMGAFQTKVPMVRAAGYSLADFYFSAITPSATGGQPMQLYYMTRDGFGLSQSSFSLLLMAAVYQLMVMVYGVAMIAMRFSFVRGQGTLMKWLLFFGVLVNGGCSAAILLIILKRSLVERIMMTSIHILSRLKIVKSRLRLEYKAAHLIDEYSRGGDWLKKNPIVFGKVAALTLCRLTALFMVPYFASLALGMKGIGPMEFLAIQAILSLAVTAVPLPGSVGASEGSFLLLYGGIVAADKVFPMMLLSRGISFYILLVISGVATLVLQFNRYRGGKVS